MLGLFFSVLRASVEAPLNTGWSGTAEGPPGVNPALPWGGGGCGCCGLWNSTFCWLIALKEPNAEDGGGD